MRSILLASSEGITHNQNVFAKKEPGASPYHVYLESLAPGSRRAMAGALRAIVTILAGDEADPAAFRWWEMRYEDTAHIRATLAARYAPATANRHIAALKGCLKACWRLGQMPADAYLSVSDIEPVRGSSPPRGRMLDSDELSKLLAACWHDPVPTRGARNAALLGILAGGGLRRGEAASLDVTDFDRETGELTVRSGKGHKARTVPLPEGARAAISRWLEVRGTEPGPLLCAITKGGNVTYRRLTADAVYTICKRLAATADVARFSPHDLRRSFISNLLASGCDLSLARELAGHASPTTTVKYDKRGKAALIAAVGRLRIPFQEGGDE